ncbi:MAG: FAD-binding protein [Candidatus Marinimicrobia bacterium]|nr:FAD-binding protein [Candidatus Neomarinimicrobiota bacterium]
MTAEERELSDGEYKKLTPELIDVLRNIVGAKYVLYDDFEKVEPYSHDEVVGEKWAHMPDAVVKPRTAEEIAAIMRLANREKIPVTPRGAGSGLSGGAVPVHGGILLSLERMDQILEIDRANMVAVVEPGVITNNINTTLAEEGLFFAGYPMSVESCFIGGNVAENAGGGRAVKYGVTGRYIIGLEVVTPEGDIIHLGGKRVKDVVGYDLIHLMVGSEGTLGIFTKIFIKLLPLPVKKVNLLVLFKDISTAVALVPKIMTYGKIIPTAVEFMDRTAVELACKYLNEHLYSQEVGAMLLIELDGSDEEQLVREYEVIGEMCQSAGAIEVFVADNYTTQERVWAVRRNVPEGIQAAFPVKASEDLVVPIASLPELLPKIAEIAAKFDVVIPCFGHAGDGNIHSTIAKRPEMPAEKWEKIEEQVRNELYQLVLSYGGTISGEHGIGHKRIKYMQKALEPATITLMKRIKQAFDPNLILNPGKLFK